jgi:hypothetical protein
MDGRGGTNGTESLSRIVLDMDPPPEEATKFVVTDLRSLAFGPLPGGASG